MKTIFVFGLLALTTIKLQAQHVEKIWETDKILNVPESVLFNQTEIYVSCINGKPTEKNQQGYIAKLDTNGDLIKLKWATGLNAPKGIAIYKDYLYATDINRIAKIALTNGKITRFFQVPGSQFLNDLAVNKSGTLFISDMYDNSIYKLENDTVLLLTKSDALQSVNGLYAGNNVLFAGTQGIVFKVDENSGDVEAYIKNIGAVDGIEMTENQQFIISDWAGKVQLISPINPPIVLLDNSKQKINAADLDYNKADHMLYVPTFYGNTVTAYKISF